VAGARVGIPAEVAAFPRRTRRSGGGRSDSHADVGRCTFL